MRDETSEETTSNESTEQPSVTRPPVLNGREGILSKIRQRTVVEVEGIRLASMTEPEREKYNVIERQWWEKQKRRLPPAWLLVRCIVDEDMKRIFTNDDVAVFQAADVDGGWVNRLYEAAYQICFPEAKSVEVHTKN